MAGPTDFLRLYQELGITPGATLEELRHAYRRRVSALHPDRIGQTYSATEPGAGERLQQITALYGAATQFHRQHGRLPGAPAPMRVVSGSETLAAARPAPPPRRSSRIIWLLGLAIVAVWLIWLPPWEDSTTSDADTTASEPATSIQPRPVALAPLPLPAETLKIGMTEDKVLALQGQPVGTADDRWDYGPSWISFEKKKVSDWYSSPMRPLKGATRHPPPPPRTAAEREP